MKMTTLISILVLGFSTFAQAATITCSNSSTDYVIINEETKTATVKSASGEETLRIAGYDTYPLGEERSHSFDIEADDNFFGIFEPLDQEYRWHTYYDFGSNVDFVLHLDDFAGSDKYVAWFSNTIRADREGFHSYKSCINN